MANYRPRKPNRYVRVHVEADERGVAQAEVRLGEAGRVAVLAAVGRKILSCAEEAYSEGMDDMLH